MRGCVRIELLGGLRVVDGSRVVTRFRSRKAGLFLARLAYHPHRSHLREELCDWLWPDTDPEAARHNLRNVLHWLRQALEPEDAPAARLLLANRTTVQLDADRVTTDVAEFAAALDAAARSVDGPERAWHLARAVDLYRGPLLPAFYDGWVLQEREWLAQRFFQALGQRIAWLEQAGDLDAALELAQRGVRLDPLREEPHADLMRLYAAAGQPSAATRQYQELERLLQQELGEPPSAAIRALAGRIERQSLIRTPRVAPRSTPLPTSQSERPSTGRTEGEQRLVTLLSAGVTISLETTDELPPCEVSAVVDRLSAAVVDAVLKYGGRIERFQPSEMLATFGMPEAHEDDAERAIWAALEIREAAQALGLELVAGVDTGTVAVGVAGPGPEQERSLQGTAVALAAQLRERARPGQILVGEATRYQSRRAFWFRPLSPDPGEHSEPGRVYAVIDALPRAEKARGIEGLRADLIGRERELARLQELLTAAASGHGQMVSLTGEAGVGKSRLVAELKAGERLPLWLEGRCLEWNMPTPYSLFRDLLRECFAWQPEATEEERVARLVALLDEFVEGGELSAERAEEMGPLLGNLYSLRFGDDRDLRLKNASPEQIRHQTLVTLQEFFTALARRQPTVLVLEDLHWADPLSLDLIFLLMEVLPRAPLFLLCVYRPEQEHRCAQLAAIASRKCIERFTEISLRELSLSESRRMVEALLGSAPLPAPVTEEILQQAQGNPFFIEELIYPLIEAGDRALSPHRPCNYPLIPLEMDERIGPSPDPTRHAERSEIPSSVQAVIQSRVDRLDREARRLLESASVMGRLFRPRLLAGVLQSSGLEPLLWELEGRGLIHRERVVPEEEYSFHHVLTQETIYGSLLEPQRAALHQQVGEAIESLYAGALEEQWEQLAYHYERSPNDAKAIGYLLKAGEKTRRAYLSDAAIGYFQRALTRLETGSASPVQQIEALGGLGHSWLATGNAQAAREQFEKAVALGGEAGLTPRELARLYGWWAESTYWVGDVDCHRIGAEGLAVLGSDTECVEAIMLRVYAMTRETLREYTLQNARALSRLPSYAEELRGAYYWVIQQHVSDKDVAGARQWCSEFRRKAEAQVDQRSVAAAICLEATVAGRQGDLEGMIRLRREGLDRYSRIGDVKHRFEHLRRLAQECARAGRLDEAWRSAEESLRAAERIGGDWLPSNAHLLIADIALCMGLLERAREGYHRGVLGIFPPEFPEHLSGPVLSLWWGLARLFLAWGERACAIGTLQEVAPYVTTDADSLCAILCNLEEAMEDGEAFRAYCRRLQEQRPAVRDLSLTQWWLDPAAPCDDFGSAVTDCEFQDTAWTRHDPWGDCAFEPAAGLVIRAANGRDLERVNLSAPRLLRSAAGDVAIETSCLPALADRPAIGGLLLWKDQENYLRLDRGTRGPAEISFSGCLANREVILGRGRLPAERIYLRLERRGGQVRALCSADGEHWLTAGETAFPVTEPVQVGVHAIGEIERRVYQGAFLEGSAIRFEQFTLRHAR
jgi:DNA-binding SARP family transcriptional activator